MTERTISEQRRWHLRIARNARRVMRGAVGLVFLAAAWDAVAGYGSTAVFFFLVTIAFACFDAVILGPFMRDVTDAVGRAEQREAAVEAVWPRGRGVR